MTPPEGPPLDSRWEVYPLYIIYTVRGRPFKYTPKCLDYSVPVRTPDGVQGAVPLIYFDPKPTHGFRLRRIS